MATLAHRPAPPPRVEGASLSPSAPSPHPHPLRASPWLASPSRLAPLRFSPFSCSSAAAHASYFSLVQRPQTWLFIGWQVASGLSSSSPNLVLFGLVDTLPWLCPWLCPGFFWMICAPGGPSSLLLQLKEGFHCLDTCCWCLTAHFKGTCIFISYYLGST